MINIDRQRAIFGISNNSAAMLPVNYVLLITRHYIYRCNIISTGFNLSSSENNVKQFLEIEKLIRIKKITNDKIKKYWEKWFVTAIMYNKSSLKINV